MNRGRSRGWFPNVRQTSPSSSSNHDSPNLPIQVDVVRSFNDMDGSQWKHSLFGNPNDPETFRCVLGAAINVYANRHKERHDRLIDMLTSSHR
ncbi:hypothetical protein IFM89_021118 [Coptis chinensis]|uniref:Uncharacterized protein n=1 Tax=Coptis chinensis TaxID=261450 RepID=A0A835HNP1_9MAGN|nr:hypothetical protein IFM89_021118 [Coptis chinensis]